VGGNCSSRVRWTLIAPVASPLSPAKRRELLERYRRQEEENDRLRNENQRLKDELRRYKSTLHLLAPDDKTAKAIERRTTSARG
jgi:cell shape-determining protein MreC